MPPRTRARRAAAQDAAASAAPAAAALNNDDDDERAPALPHDLLVALLTPLAGDVSALCAAACVATAWRVAARAPSLWRELRSLFDGAQPPPRFPPHGRPPHGADGARAWRADASGAGRLRRHHAARRGARAAAARRAAS
jgi:hypothetical protein